MERKLHSVRKIAIFRDISETDCLAISRLCHWNTYNADHQILHEDDRSSELFLIVSGAVRAKSFSATGKEVTYTTLISGDIFGEFSAIDGGLRSATVATIGTENLIGRMAAEQFKSILTNYPLVSLRLAEHLVAKIRELTTRVYEYSAFNVRHRLYAELLRLCDRSVGANAGVIDPAPTHYELATLISTHREAVTKEISKLVRDGLLAVEGRKFTILDLDRFIAMAEE